MELQSLEAILGSYQNDPRILSIRKFQGLSFEDQFDPEIETKRDDLWEEIVKELKVKHPSIFVRVEVDVSLAFLDQFGIYYWADLDTLQPELQTKVRELVREYSVNNYNLLSLVGSWRYELDKRRPDGSFDFMCELCQEIFVWPDGFEGKAESEPKLHSITLPKRAQKLFEDFGFPNWAIHQLYLNVKRKMPLRF